MRSCASCGGEVPDRYPPGSVVFYCPSCEGIRVVRYPAPEPKEEK